ncbi:hypothetical protein [Alteromonas flava]|uniref:hypothetical protein n=1 Tax=Alteromonas flava TaxID=2048003 RepID=UPI000C28CED8|nr:hypothetical protein [Alteromonas flava]
MLERRWQDKYGSYTLYARDNFIESIILGAIGDNITAHFKKDIIDLAKSYGGRPFGYYADLTGSEGYTEVAEQHIIVAYKACLEFGCVIDAMTIKSPLVKAQMERVSDIVGIDLPLAVRMFESREAGIAFVEKLVQKTKDRLAK